MIKGVNPMLSRRCYMLSIFYTGITRKLKRIPGICTRAAVRSVDEGWLLWIYI
jgi:hypothetical protein